MLFYFILFYFILFIIFYRRSEFLYYFFFIYFMIIFPVPGCSGMFRDVPGCSEMFHVPGFVNARYNVLASLIAQVELFLYFKGRNIFST